MKRIEIVGLCLVAMCVSAFAATSAWAISTTRPHYYKCEKAEKVGKTYNGEYSNKTCTTKAAGGKYRLKEEEAEKTFTVKGKGATFTVDGIKVKCGKDLGEGNIVEAYTSEEKITFSKCGVNGSKKEPCGTEGQKGTITTSKLSTELWYTSKEENEAAYYIYGWNKSPITCQTASGSQTFEIEEGVVGTIENTKRGMTMTFAVNASGKQALSERWQNGSPAPPETLQWKNGNERKEVTLAATFEQKGPKGVGVYF